MALYQGGNLVASAGGGGGAFESHISDSTVHITDNERSTWNNKQNAITGTSGQIVGIGSDGTPVAQSKTIFYAGALAPSDTTIFWIDTNASTGGLKYYNGSAWVVVPVAYS